MIIPTAFCLLAYMSTSSGAKVVFGYLTSMVSTFGEISTSYNTRLVQEFRMLITSS